MPRVIKVCVTCTSAVFEPRTAVTATTSFARSLDDAAFGACRIEDRRSDDWCLYMWILVKTTKRKPLQYNSQQSLSSSLREFVLYLHVISLELTFASFDALNPPVINVPVVDTSTILEPSTTGSATTDSAGFLERTAP